MSNAVNGSAGVIIVGSDRTECDTWTITRTVEQLPADSFDTAGWGDSVDGFKRWTGTFHSLNFHDLTGSQGVATFQVDPTPAANKPSFSGTISVGECTSENPATGLVGHTYNFTGRGACGVAVA